MSRSRAACPHEGAVLAAIHAGRWPDNAAPEVRAHVAACLECAAVAELACVLRVDLAWPAFGDDAPPSSSVMWWKLQQRARRDAARAAARPVAIAQALAGASLCGLLLGLGGLAWHWLHPWVEWFGTELMGFPSLAATFVGHPPLWISTGASLAALAVLVLAPVALYFVVSEE